MEIEQLYKKLINAYSDINLNNITAQIINLYKNRDYQMLKEVAAIVSEFIDFKYDRISKCFSKLITLYHPDKGSYHLKEITKLYDNNDLNGLSNYGHILNLQSIENYTVSAESYADIDYNPQYIWDFEEHGYTFIEDLEAYENADVDLSYKKNKSYNSFYSAVKKKVYGNINVDLPSYYLEDFEDIDMAEYYIDNLDGIESCKHAKIIDLSRNYISDITKLSKLNLLEEIYLADNQINYVDGLHFLKKLRVLDISNNYIEDLSPLLNLDNLEYLNIVGNNVALYHIDLLRGKDIMVVY
ncbi:leucine-rich repeat domain-containing protein [Bacteroidota bacterium]